jgi:Transposase
VHRDREIGACKQYASNVEASGASPVQPDWQTGVRMDPAVYLGVDVGKTSHYALAVDGTGKPIYQTGVANDEAALSKLVDWSKDHQATVVVDQPGGVAALLLKLCWQANVRIGYLHGLAMARARDFYAGESKTDPKDAFVLADVARAHPTRVVWLEPSSEALAHLELLCGYDADLRADANRITNRLRGLLVAHWPALERAFGDRLDSRGVLAVLQQYPSGPAIKEAGIQQAHGRSESPARASTGRLCQTTA